LEKLNKKTIDSSSFGNIELENCRRFLFLWKKWIRILFVIDCSSLEQLNQRTVNYDSLEKLNQRIVDSSVLKKLKNKKTTHPSYFKLLKKSLVFMKKPVRNWYLYGGYLKKNQFFGEPWLCLRYTHRWPNI